MVGPFSPADIIEKVKEGILTMAFSYDDYLRTNKMPTLWCWGCGDGCDF